MHFLDTVREKTTKKSKKAEKKDFFDPASFEISNAKKNKSFYDMELSRPILKVIIWLLQLIFGMLGCHGMWLFSADFDSERVYPRSFGRQGYLCMFCHRDRCVKLWLNFCSSLFSGKTAAFMLPILERLLYRPRKSRSVTRVLVLAPTRELAIQIFQVARKLAQFSSVEICLCAGKLYFQIFIFR
jgi:hypothetical protein